MTLLHCMYTRGYWGKKLIIAETVIKATKKDMCYELLLAVHFEASNLLTSYLFYRVLPVSVTFCSCHRICCGDGLPYNIVVDWRISDFSQQ